MGTLEAGKAFLYTLTALTSAVAVSTIIYRPRWLRSAAWRARHPR